jgi:hypothetical protein
MPYGEDMKTTKWIVALSAVLLSLPALDSTSAKAETAYTDFAPPIQTLENGWGSQQVIPVSCDSAGCCSTGATSGCCASPSWYVGYELTVLQPYVANTAAAINFDDEYGFGHRLVAGYDGGSGMGARLRFWFYNHGHDLVPPVGSLGIDMDVLDLEFTLNEQLRNWDLMVSGGVRYGRLGLTLDTLGIGLGNGELAFEGVGPTVSLEATRAFGDHNLYLIGNARTSLLIGDWRNSQVLGFANLDDDLTTVFESQLGVGYTCQLNRATLNIRTVWETQFWMNDTIADDLFGAGSNLAFAGPTSTLELKF